MRDYNLEDGEVFEDEEELDELVVERTIQTLSRENISDQVPVIPNTQASPAPTLAMVGNKRKHAFVKNTKKRQKTHVDDEDDHDDDDQDDYDNDDQDNHDDDGQDDHDDDARCIKIN